MTRYQHIIRAVLARPWAIDPESLAWGAILDVLALRAAGGSLSDEEISARIEAAGNGPRIGGGRQRNVAVIPIYGPITPRSSLMEQTSGGSTAETIRDDFRAALADADVDGIVFDVDSPGGVVEGIDELAAEIRGARGQKPVAAVANHMAASAAYWAVAGVDELVATPSASVGSIGVFTAHQDVSAAMEREGVVTTLISAGKYKTEGNQYQPLGDEARTAIQEQVDAWYATMTSSIAKGRGVPVDTVRSSFGEGRTLMARKALDRGMIDRIDSLDNTIRRVARGAIARPGATRGFAGVDLGGTIIEVPADAVSASEEPETSDAPTFAARAEAAAAEIRAIRAEAAKRAALRAEAGREPAAADVHALTALATALGQTEPDPEPEEEPDETIPETTTAKRLGLDLFEAAARGGYRI